MAEESRETLKNLIACKANFLKAFKEHDVHRSLSSSLLKTELPSRSPFFGLCVDYLLVLFYLYLVLQCLFDKLEEKYAANPGQIFEEETRKELRDLISPLTRFYKRASPRDSSFTEDRIKAIAWQNISFLYS